MSSIDSLPADQRAVLQLVLKRGRGYDDIAAMLSIDRGSVRQRALDALNALGPQNEIPALERSLLTDYLLGQLPPRVAEQVNLRLAGSAAEHAWAQAVSDQLAVLGGAEAKEIPALSPSVSQAPGVPIGEAAAPPLGQATQERYGADVSGIEDERGVDDEFEVVAGEPVPDGWSYPPGDGPDRFEPPPPRRVEPSRRRTPAPGARPPASSRRGGAVLLALGALLVIAAVIIVIVVTGGNSPKRHPTQASTTSSTPTTSTTTAANQAKLLSTIELTSPTGKKRTLGVAQVIREDHGLGIVIAATGLPANSRADAYAVWLYNSPRSSFRVGFVNTRVTRTGRLETDGPLPPHAGSYKEVLLTIETERNPTQPGAVILSGRFTVS